MALPKDAANLDGNWALFLGLRASMTTAAAGQEVRFLMPDSAAGTIRAASATIASAIAIR